MRFNETYDGDLVPKRTKWTYSTVAIGRDAAYTLVALFLVTFIQFSGVLTRGLDASADLVAAYASMYGVITAIIIGYRIFDALNDPFMGVIVEKCHFKTGKYKPWILIGGLSNAVVVLALFCGPGLFPWLNGWAYVAWFAVFYLLWGLTFTMNDIAYWAVLPSLTSEEKQRTNITTLMMIFCSIGQFLVGGLVPVITGMTSYEVYYWIAIIVAVLFAASQIFCFFFMKEHKRDLVEEQKHPVPKFRDMLTVVKKNDQVRWMTIILFIYYLASGILNALGMNYFYFASNYTVGSTLMTIFTIVYGLGMLGSQIVYPMLAKRFTRATLLKYSGIAVVVGYLLFFVYGLPIGGGNYLSPAPILADGSMNVLYIIPLCLIGLVIFFAQGIIYVVLILMMTNTIEYNEWKFGERKESVIFSIRPLTTKLGSALQQGVLYLFIVLAGLTSFITAFNNYQNEYVSGFITQAEMQEGINVVLGSVEWWNVFVFKLGVAILPVILLVVVLILIKKFYIIDEKLYAQICSDIKARREAEAASSGTVTEEAK